MGQRYLLYGRISGAGLARQGMHPRAESRGRGFSARLQGSSSLLHAPVTLQGRPQIPGILRVGSSAAHCQQSFRPASADTLSPLQAIPPSHTPIRHVGRRARFRLWHLVSRLRPRHLRPRSCRLSRRETRHLPRRLAPFRQSQAYTIDSREEGRHWRAQEELRQAPPSATRQIPLAHIPPHPRRFYSSPPSPRDSSHTQRRRASASQPSELALLQRRVSSDR